MAFFNEDISLNSIIGPGSAIKGNLKINGFMRIDGDLDGNLETSGNVIVGNQARIKGNILAKSITVGGIVKGNITAPEGVHLLSTSAVLGNIQTKKLQADENVVLHGHCISIPNQEAFENASSTQNNRESIAAKSVQVQNGRN